MRVSQETFQYGVLDAGARIADDAERRPSLGARSVNGAADQVMHHERFGTLSDASAVPTRASCTVRHASDGRERVQAAQNPILRLAPDAERTASPLE